MSHPLLQGFLAILCILALVHKNVNPSTHHSSTKLTPSIDQSSSVLHVIFQSASQSLYSADIKGFESILYMCVCSRQTYTESIRYYKPLCSFSFNSNSLSHLAILLLLSGQIESNPGPGPSTDVPTAFPCAVCGDEVHANDPAILCDHCDFWCHIHCVGISSHSYEVLTNNSRSFAWTCFQCNSINIGSSSSFQELDVTQSNRYSLLQEELGVDEEYSPPVSQQTSTPTSSPVGHTKPPHFCFPSKSKKNIFKVMTVNCNGLKSGAKKSGFLAAVAHHSPDFILGCESKLDDSISTYSIFPSNYSVYRKDRNRHGGGVFIAISDLLSVTECPEFITDCELLWCKILLKDAKPLYIGSYYCPPNDKQHGVEGLKQSLGKLQAKYSRSQPSIVITGDFNHPDINWDTQTTTNPATNACHQKLLDILLENFLFQIVREVTRPASGNILDLIITSNPALIQNVSIHPGISDHSILTFDLDAKFKTSGKSQRRIYQFNKADPQQLGKACEDFCTKFLQSDPEMESVESNWNTISQFLTKLMSDLVPSKMSKGKKHLPWVSISIKRQMRKRDRLFKKARRQSCSAAWREYRQFRNKVAKAVHKAHCDYINNVIGASLQDNPKSFWSYIKMCRSENIGIPPLRTSTKLCATGPDKAEALNEYFQSVFTQEQPYPLPQKEKSPYPTIGHLHIHRTGVEKQLRNLNPAKAHGPDELPPKLLKIVAHEIAPALSFLFQQSHNCGVVPTQWRQAPVTPIHKSGVKSDPANYRPISLTCICCKVMEHIVLSHISKHLAANNILTEAQHGFRQQLSTTTQLTSVVHDWSSTLQKRSQVDAVFLDFQKAFDRVPHKRLDIKLEYYGIIGDSKAWIMSLLSGRKQAVVVDGSQSSWRDVTSGVPQGSVIGPTLFLLYINDIQDNTKCTVRLFADDCVIYREIRNDEDHLFIQSDLEYLSAWSSNWLMNFNIKKCAILSITRKRKPRIYQYLLLNEVIPRVDQYKYLGVTITADLRWEKHCQTIRHKASRTLGLLRRTLPSCSSEVKSKAYTALVRPQLEYGSEAWNPHNVTTINGLEKIQKTAARFVCSDYRKSTSSESLISSLKWDSLHTRRLLAQCTLFYKIQYQQVAVPFPAVVLPAAYHGRYDHNLKYTVPAATMDIFKFSFFPRVIKIWNHLPSHAVNIQGTDNFKEAALPVLRTMQPHVGSSVL